MQQKALAPEISTWPDESPQLIGSRCGECEATTFPVQQWCPRCSAGRMSEVLLPRRGTLIAWTTQGFPPGAPYAGPTGKDFVPFGVGGQGHHGELHLLAELQSGRVVFGQSPLDAKHGFCPQAELDETDADGTEILTFAFQPV
ncbi:DNA-binding protein [Mycobacterium sp. E2462]|uniref:Zn-ribbon domain-containing OB-fold protein n=1 Tax=Mycobacterium sp. E2462 TaxID=1834133 RepID=UPI0007FF5139|nr:zinc ribbon domain-containing protein [Mycobacterium sp. E2462]OBI04035.1 DNA-binding protein [Mycobacterium sp. E2462]